MKERKREKERGKRKRQFENNNRGGGIYTYIYMYRIYKYIHGKVVLNRFFGILSERLPDSHGYLSPYSNV